MTLKRTKEQIEFDLRMGVAGMASNKRWCIRHPLTGPLTPYETPYSREHRRIARKHCTKKQRVKHIARIRVTRRKWDKANRNRIRRYQAQDAKRHPDTLQRRRVRYRERNRVLIRLKQVARRLTLVDSYVSELFRHGTALTSADVPPEIIVSVRSVLHAKRIIRGIRRAAAAGEHPGDGRAPGLHEPAPAI